MRQSYSFEGLKNRMYHKMLNGICITNGTIRIPLYSSSITNNGNPVELYTDTSVSSETSHDDSLTGKMWTCTSILTAHYGYCVAYRGTISKKFLFISDILYDTVDKCFLSEGMRRTEDIQNHFAHEGIFISYNQNLRDIFLNKQPQIEIRDTEKVIVLTFPLEQSEIKNLPDIYLKEQPVEITDEKVLLKCKCHTGTLRDGGLNIDLVAIGPLYLWQDVYVHPVQSARNNPFLRYTFRKRCLWAPILTDNLMTCTCESSSGMIWFSS